MKIELGSFINRSNNNFKKQFKISRSKLSVREYVLVLLLLMVLEGYLLINYIVMPQWDAYRENLKRVEALRQTERSMRNEFEKMSEYQDELILQQYRLEKMKKAIPDYVSQEEAILFLEDAGKKSGLNITATAFQGQTYIKDNKDSQNIQAFDKGKYYEQLISLNARGSVNAINKFLNAAAASKRKIFVKNITIHRQKANDISASIQLSFPSYTIQDWSRYMMKDYNVNIKDDIFKAYPGFIEESSSNAGNMEKALKNPDFIAYINSYDDNAPKVIIGQYSKPETEIYFNANADTNISVAISGKNGRYKYSYTLGKLTREDEFITSSPYLLFHVVSQPIKNSEDKVRANISIKNESDRVFKVVRVFAGNADKRIVFEKVEGNVVKE